MNLLEALPQYFNRAPEAITALRIEAGEDFTWSISGRILTLTPDGDAALTYDLSTLTLSQLAAALVADGLSVPWTAWEVEDLSAVILLEGSGSGAQAHLGAYTSLLWCLTDQLSREVATLAGNARNAADQLTFSTAYGPWMDKHGALYGYPRANAETDEDYAARLLVEITRPRSNRLAIEAALSESLGKAISVFEPWTQVLHASGYAPTLSVHRLRDRDFWTHGTIEVSGGTRAEMHPWAERYRAAGVLPRYREDYDLDLTCQATVDVVLYGMLFIPLLGSQAFLWCAGETPQGGSPFGNEPWQWVAQDGVMAHASVNAAGVGHQHGIAGIAGGECPAGWSLITQVYLDPAAEPISLYLGWRINGNWYYARWGSDTLSAFLTGYNVGRLSDQGAMPESGRWLTLAVPLSAFGLSGGEACDGLAFALYGGRAWYGWSGVMFPLSLQAEEQFHYATGSGASSYQIGGVTQVDLYTAIGTYVNAADLAAEYGEVLYRMDAPDIGDVSLLAGGGWRLGDLVAAGYRAGNDEVDLTVATWTTGAAGVTVSLTKTS